jgi:TonB-dependent SusC/RagA subfamily outer membrane receptor
MSRRVLLLLVAVLVSAPVSAQQTPVQTAQVAKGALLVIDDVVIGEGVLMGLNLKDLESLNIISFEIVKKELATRLYGQRGSDGAIVIRTRPEGTAGPPAKLPLQVTVNGNLASSPLMIVDGVAVGYSTQLGGMIDKKRIESIEVVKGAAATKLYGEHATNGVVMIKTKK